MDFYTASVAAAVVAVVAAADCACTACAAATALVAAAAAAVAVAAAAAAVESTLFADSRAVASVNSCSRTNLASYCTSNYREKSQRKGRGRLTRPLYLSHEPIAKPRSDSPDADRLLHRVVLLQVEGLLISSRVEVQPVR